MVNHGNPIFFAAIIVGQVDGRTRKDKWTDGQTEKRKSRQTDGRSEEHLGLELTI